VPLQTGPWEPGLSSSVSPLDDLAGFDTREVILRWPVSRQRTVYGRLTAAGWKDLVAIRSGHDEAWREPRILVRHGSGYVAFSTYVLVREGRDRELVTYSWQAGSEVRPAAIQISH